MLTSLLEEGTLLVAHSCTEELQQFHKPKKHKASPVKASSLGRGVSDQLDPRPENMRNRPGYQMEVNMRTVNYCNYTGRDSMWRFKFGKADVQTAATDHRYERLPMTEN